MRSLQAFSHAIVYVALLRYSILCVAVLAGLKWMGLRLKPTLLAGLFDVNGRGMAVVTMVAFLCSWTVLNTMWLVLAYGSYRFHLWGSIWPARPGMHWYEAGTLPGLFVVWGVFQYSPAQNPSQKKRGLWLGFAVGAVLAFLLLGTITYLGKFLEPLRLRTHRLEFLFRVLGSQGYVDEKGNLLAGHFGALTLFLGSLLVYAFVGLYKLGRRGRPSSMPTLAYVLLLLMLACWFLPAMAFALDGHHVPILLAIFAWLVIFSRSPRSDHFFDTSPVPSASEHELRAPSPAEVLRYPEEGGNVILVAASGGGIQAAAWTARVLTGLEHESNRIKNDGRFARAIRLISSVSGGSVGAMYFTSRYRNGGILPGDLQEIVDNAEASCLENIAWGLAYPDLWRVLAPLWFWTFGGRGRALEKAWMRTSTLAQLLSAKLSDWFGSVRDGTRPASIFNATIAESGDRLLLSTTYLPVGRPATPPARWDFHQLYRDRDVAIVTAARLSATFPYITPAARADVGGPDTPQFHVVDGGYFDNYGVSTLLEWLDNGLTELQNNNPERFAKLKFLVVEIHEAPDPHRIVPPRMRQRHSWFFQTYAPLETLFSVRTAGQRSHNQLEFSLMREKWKDKIEIGRALFEFGTPEPEAAVDPEKLRSALESSVGKASPGPECTSTAATPPLSWHLTEIQKRAIEEEWELQRNNSQGIKVRDFLQAQMGASETRIAG